LKRFILAIAAAIGALVLISAGLFLWVYYKGLASGVEPVAVPGAAPYIRPTATLQVAPSPTPPTPGSPLPAQTSPTPAPVSFGLMVQQSRPPESSVLLSASVKVYLHAALSNLGDFDAHNVNVTARARVEKDYVAIDGKQALVVSLEIGRASCRERVS
jgi:hypothetical protein